MPKQITFEGKVYSFPDDATDDEISEALSQPSQAAVNPNAPNPITTAMQQSTRGINQRFAEQRRGFQYIPTGMGIAPPSNLMRTPSGMYVENPRVERPEDTLEGYGRTLAYALSPYVTAGALGAAAGSPSGVGVIPGAIFGTGSVLLSDLASSLYNAVGPQFGGPKIGYASDVIRNAYANAVPNLVAPPETTGQRYLYSAANAAAGGLTGASAFKEAAKVVGPGLVRNVMTTLGGGTPATNLVASGTAGLSGQAAREFNAPPIVQFGAELFGGALGAYGATGVNAMRRGGVAAQRPEQVTTTKELEQKATARFEESDQAGVRYSKDSIRQLLDDLSSPSALRRMGLETAPSISSFMAGLKGRLATGEKDVIGPRGLFELRRTANEEAGRKGDLALVAKELRLALDRLLADDTASLNAQRANVSGVLNQIDNQTAELAAIPPGTPAHAAKQAELNATETQFQALLDSWSKTDPGMRKVRQAYDDAQLRLNRVMNRASGPSERAQAQAELDDAYDKLLQKTRDVAPPSATATDEAKAALANQNRLRQEAVDLFKRSERGAEIDAQMELITRDIVGGADPRKAIQSGLKRLLTVPSFKQFATKEQKEAVERALRGDLSENVLATIGSFSPVASGWRSLLSSMGVTAGLMSGALNPLLPVAAVATPVVTMASRAAANVAAENKLNMLAETLKTGAMPPKPPSMRPGLATAVGTTAAVATPKETEAKREERELAKPKTKLNIIETPANDREVQRMLRVARDIIEDPDFGKKYTLPEIVKLYNVLYDAGEAGYSDVIPFADELGNYYDQRSEFENRVKQLGASR